MSFYPIKRNAGFEATMTARNILLKPLHGQQRSCVRIANKDGGLATVVVEHLQTDGEFVGIARCKHLDFGPNLDSSLGLGERVPIEVNRNHLAEWDGERPLRAGDYHAVGINEPPVYDEAACFADVGEGEASGLAQSDANGVVIDDNGLRLHRAEGEERQDERAED